MAGTLPPDKSPERRNRTYHDGAKYQNTGVAVKDSALLSEDEQQRHDRCQREAVVGENAQGVMNDVAQEEPDGQVPHRSRGEKTGAEHDRLPGTHAHRRYLDELQGPCSRDFGDAHEEGEALRLPPF